MAVVFLLNAVFLALSTLSNVVSRLILTSTAYFLVLIIQAFKVPGEAIHGGLEWVAEVIKTCFEHFLELGTEVTSTLISTLFDLLKEGILGSAVATGLAIGGLVEMTRTSLDGLLKDLPAVLEGFSEMVSTMVVDLWNNCMDAVGHVSENA